MQNFLYSCSAARLLFFNGYFSGFFAEFLPLVVIAEEEIPGQALYAPAIISGLMYSEFIQTLLPLLTFMKNLYLTSVYSETQQNCVL